MTDLTVKKVYEVVSPKEELPALDKTCLIVDIAGRVGVLTGIDRKKSDEYEVDYWLRETQGILISREGLIELVNEFVDAGLTLSTMTDEPFTSQKFNTIKESLITELLKSKGLTP